MRAHDASFVLWDGKNVYSLSDQKTPEKFAGQKVTVKVDAYPSRTFDGHIDSIQSGTGQRFSVLPAENATGNYVKVVQRVPVKILLDTLPDPKFRLAPGMSVVPTVRVD